MFCVALFRRWSDLRVAVAAAIATVLALAAVPAHASAWNRAAGDGLAIVDYTLDQGGHYFDGSGKLLPTRAYSKSEAAAYVEYGATDWLMLLARPSFDWTRIGAPDGGRYTGPGGSVVGGQVQIYNYGGAVLAVQSTFRLPGARPGESPAVIGDTAREGDVRGLAGESFLIGPYAAFVEAQGSYRLRSGGAAPQVHADLSAGIRFVPQLLLMLQSFTTVPTGNGNAVYPSSRTSQLEVKAVYDLTPQWSVHIGAFTTIYGRDALRERGVTTGLWRYF